MSSLCSVPVWEVESAARTAFPPVWKNRSRSASIAALAAIRARDSPRGKASSPDTREMTARRQRVEEFLPLQAGGGPGGIPVTGRRVSSSGHFHEQLFQERGAEHGIAPAVNVTVGEGEAPSGAPDRQEKEERLFLSFFLSRAEGPGSGRLPKRSLSLSLKRG